MRGVPRTGRLVVAQAMTVGVAKYSAALRTARPIFASHVFVGRKSGAVRPRAGEKVMPVGLVANTIVHLTLFGERGLFGEVVGAMELRDILGDDHALGVRPRTFADAIACVHGIGALRG